MRKKLASLARTALGRHAHRFGLDAAPFEHVVKPIFQLRRNIERYSAHHDREVARNREKLRRVSQDNERRIAETARAARIYRNLSTLLGED